MIISVQRIVDRLRHPRSRADELADVRRRLIAQPSAREVSLEEVLAAKRVRAIAAELAAAQNALGLTACATCAVGREPPHGAWDGGFCCGGATDGVFTDDELAALRLAGTTPSRLVPPSDQEHAGCAFRGAHGCSLAADDRPSICVHYVCRDLAAAFAAKDRAALARIDALAAELAAAFADFRALRRAREADHFFAGV
jgi:hypothetical protein